MTLRLLARGGLLVLVAAIAACAPAAPDEAMEEAAPGYVPPEVTPPSRELVQADIEQMMEDLSNWGRWGPDDELGAANLITPEKRLEALALATEGITVSLAHRVLKEEAEDVPLPFGHSMLGVPDSSAEPELLRGRERQLHRQLPRLLAQPHRLAVPHPLQGADVQRRLAGHHRRGGLHQRLDRPTCRVAS